MIRDSLNLEEGSDSAVLLDAAFNGGIPPAIRDKILRIANLKADVAEMSLQAANELLNRILEAAKDCKSVRDLTNSFKIIIENSQLLTGEATSRDELNIKNKLNMSHRQRLGVYDALGKKGDK